MNLLSAAIFNCVFCYLVLALPALKLQDQLI